ncbi:restriction endonuclease PLD domain-containing protein [Candidatus Magnetomonas plexicatena]|uniref:restriction endonuclease PLD domain-containing protein n=1 Tax=Candidatus Magnetomonas plexicatena TaxID=2552947 RepID=UPI0011014EAB|nr:NgoFVII family restriction endonuclease [Nitrospirales bacterium LBB_01]
MITKNLFDKVLVDPVKKGADTLYVVSGYATANMTVHHFNFLKKNYSKQININLIVGMCPYDGIAVSNHKAFQQLARVDFHDHFECSYIFNPPQVHSKAYTWFQGKNPFSGFVGSANYTQNAFSKSQRELLIPCDPKLGFDYFQSLISDSIYCTHNEIENFVKIYRDTNYSLRNKEIIEKQGTQPITYEKTDFQNLPPVRVPLLDHEGNVQKTAGLNWGFRQDKLSKRNKNEAYIQLRPEVYKSDFFPVRSIPFTVLTDDDKTLICTRAQKDKQGHAIETPQKNSLIGEYFRNRLGLPNGAFVTKDDLMRYGRTDVDFYKIDDETYFMDFSVSAHNG